VVAWIIVIAVARVATNLRPLADDYCHGAKATLGYLGSIVAWYQTWIGDLFQMSITALLVGQPLAHLPLWMASAIPFLATLVVVALVGVVVIGAAPRGARADRILLLMFALPVVIVTWLGFWWVPAAIEPSPSTDPWLLAAAVTDWQTVGVQYALVPALLIGSAVLIGFRRGQRAWLRLILVGLLGLASGLGGLVFGVAALVFVPLALVARIIHDRALSRVRLIEGSVFVVLCAIGIAVAYLAPGSRVRNSGLLDVRPFGADVTPVEVVRWVLPQGVIQGVGMIVGAGTLVAFIIGVGIALVASRLGAVATPAPIATVGLGLLFFSLVIAVVSRAADGFSYEAFWHEVEPRTVIFLGALALGAAMGTWLGGHPTGAGRMAQVVALAAVAVVTATVLGSLLIMQSHVTERLAQWSVGAAPSSAMDLETKWVRECWAMIGDFRPVPDRVP
jgi:MFS family permease